MENVSKFAENKRIQPLPKLHDSKTKTEKKKEKNKKKKNKNLLFIP